jgi:hypothetical protein
MKLVPKQQLSLPSHPSQASSGSAQPTKKKEKNAISALDPKFYATIMRLARIALPSWKSKGSMLFVAQFFLLVRLSITSLYRPLALFVLASPLI